MHYWEQLQRFWFISSSRATTGKQKNPEAVIAQIETILPTSLRNRTIKSMKFSLLLFIFFPSALVLLNTGVSSYLLVKLLHLTRAWQRWPYSPCIKMEDGHGERGKLKGRKRSGKEGISWCLLYSSSHRVLYVIIRAKTWRNYRVFWTVNNQRLVQFCIRMLKFNHKSSSVPFSILIYLILAS